MVHGIFPAVFPNAAELKGIGIEAAAGEKHTGNSLAQQGNAVSVHLPGIYIKHGILMSFRVVSGPEKEIISGNAHVENFIEASFVGDKRQRPLNPLMEEKGKNIPLIASVGRVCVGAGLA